MSFFRYPGGKSKLKDSILAKLSSLLNPSISEYREPFLGGGSIGLSLLAKHDSLQNIWINDADFYLACLWTSVIHYPTQLKERIKAYTPHVDDFYSFKRVLSIANSNLHTVEHVVDKAFMKLALHQISYSGLGLKSGGPLGGKDQKSKYKIDCRWSPDYICTKIDKVSSLLTSKSLRSNTCSAYDFDHIISDTSNKSLIYLDPPYYLKGGELYHFSFSLEDHKRLSKALKATKHSWVLSYDDCNEIRNLYNWAKIEEVSVNYSINSSRNKSELLITEG